MSESDYIVRRLQPSDAAGVTALVQRVYGDSYIHRDLYEPESIVEENESDRLISVVALSAGQVVGHYAIERFDLGPIGETGEAMVLPEHRHHHLMERMRQQLVETGRQLGMAGLFGLAVTNHLFTQKSYHHSQGRPTGICLGQVPRSFHNTEQALTQRLSTVLYFEYLRQPAPRTWYAPAEHRGVLKQIAGQFNLVIDFAEGASPSGPAELQSSYDPALQTGLIRVIRAGRDAIEQARALQAAWRRAGAEAIVLDLPLGQPGTTALCRQAESAGFFFSGMGPLFAGDGDALRLQYLATPLDLSVLQILDPLAQELVAYVGREWQRVGPPGG